MNSSAGGKSSGQLEQISPVGRLDGIREEHFGQKNKDTETKVKKGYGEDGEKCTIQLYKQIMLSLWVR